MIIIIIVSIGPNARPNPKKNILEQVLYAPGGAGGRRSGMQKWWGFARKGLEMGVEASEMALLP